MSPPSGVDVDADIGMDVDMDVDVALLGGGGAGLTLLLAIEQEARARGAAVPSIALIDPVHRSGSDRTWCWWEPAAGGPLSHVLHRSWTAFDLYGSSARPIRVDLGDLRYVMLRSQDLYDEADRVVQRLGVARMAAAGEVTGAAGDRVQLAAGGEKISARWVFDSRPAPPQQPPLTSLLQHFRGWTVRFPDAGPASFDPELPTLMDFRVPQPGHGVAFGYCLPLSATSALVEYTEFGPRRLPSAAYDRALCAYLLQRWGAEPGSYRIEAVEDGAIPMTDAGYEVRASPRVFRIGTAGGATRGSTGYTLAAAQRQATVIAQRLFDGAEPQPPLAYPARHRYLDAVLLRAIDRGMVSGPELFTGLFTRLPPAQLIRFLDGTSTPAEELAVMRASPALGMLRAGGEDAAVRAVRAVSAAGTLRRRATRVTSEVIRSVAKRYFK